LRSENDQHTGSAAKPSPRCFFETMRQVRMVGHPSIVVVRFNYFIAS
jgi:hypothetical protein